MHLADLAEGLKKDHVRPDPAGAGAGDHVPGVVGIGNRRRRYAPFTVNVERLKPWHADWPDALS